MSTLPGTIISSTRNAIAMGLALSLNIYDGVNYEQLGGNQSIAIELSFLIFMILV